MLEEWGERTAVVEEKVPVAEASHPHHQNQERTQQGKNVDSAVVGRCSEYLDEWLTKSHHLYHLLRPRRHPNRCCHCLVSVPWKLHRC